MITHLSHQSNSWIHIYKIDMAGSHLDQTIEEYFATQLDIICDEQYKQRFELKAITTFEADWILVFGPYDAK